jgi:hypothetical protein
MLIYKSKKMNYKMRLSKLSMKTNKSLIFKFIDFMLLLSIEPKSSIIGKLEIGNDFRRK